jgi:hypothetical protein
MATPHVLPSSPTANDFKLHLRDLQRGYSIYQADRRWFSFDHAGITYHVPPDLSLEGVELAEHPVERDKSGRPKMVPANGRLEIKDRWGVLYDAPRDIPHGKMTRKGFGPIKGEEASSVLIYVMTNFAARGLVILSGDQAVDEARIAAARKKNVVHRMEWAEQQRAARLEYLEKFKKAKPGGTPDPPTRDQIEAQELLDRAKLERRHVAALVCDHGDYETTNWNKFVDHMLAAHDVRNPPMPDWVRAQMEAAGLLAAPTPAAPGTTSKIAERVRQAAATAAAPLVGADLEVPAVVDETPADMVAELAKLEAQVAPELEESVFPDAISGNEAEQVGRNAGKKRTR